MKEEDKRKAAQKAAEDERKKKHVHEEYQREKKRQEIRDKYGIAKKGNNSKDKNKDLLEEIKKDYGMSDLEARELQRKMNEVLILGVSFENSFTVVFFYLGK